MVSAIVADSVRSKGKLVVVSDFGSEGMADQMLVLTETLNLQIVLVVLGFSSLSVPLLTTTSVVISMHWMISEDDSQGSGVDFSTFYLFVLWGV